MRLGQIKAEGGYLAAVFEGDLARTVPGYTVADLIRARRKPRSFAGQDRARVWPATTPIAATPAIPIVPPEVWACGCTYETSASFRDAEHGTREGMYAYVYREAAPGGFLQGHGARLRGAGPGYRHPRRFAVHRARARAGAGARQQGNIVGYTLANDVSAWDIERENALYLPQSKVYYGLLRAGPGDRDGRRSHRSLQPAR